MRKNATSAQQTKFATSKDSPLAGYRFRGLCDGKHIFRRGTDLPQSPVPQSTAPVIQLER